MSRKSRFLAPLVPALSVTGLLAGGAMAGGQLISEPRVPSVLTALPKLESVLAQQGSEGCTASTGTVFVAGGAGYQKPGESLGTADLVSATTGLSLVGSRMADVSNVVVILADGRRISPRTFLKSCTDAQGRPSIRVTFDLPPLTTPSTARLQLSAPEPAPLITPPISPPKSCNDPVTGEVKPCPTLPPPPPKQVRVADLGLVLHPRPQIASATPDRVDAVGRSTTCRARIQFGGQNLANANLSSSSTSFTQSVVSRSATAIVADVSQRCNAGTGFVFTSVSGALTLRRGLAGASTSMTTCDTCTPADGFGAAAIGFRGPSVF